MPSMNRFLFILTFILSLFINTPVQKAYATNPSLLKCNLQYDNLRRTELPIAVSEKVWSIFAKVQRRMRKKKRFDCSECKHVHLGDVTCDAYPNGIPNAGDIWFKVSVTYTRRIPPTTRTVVAKRITRTFMKMRRFFFFFPLNLEGRMSMAKCFFFPNVYADPNKPTQISRNRANSSVNEEGDLSKYRAATCQTTSMTKMIMRMINKVPRILLIVSLVFILPSLRPVLQ